MARKKIFTDRRSVILRAAERIFEHYGFAKTTMDAIAKEAGIPRATVYLDFCGKEEVLMASIEEKLQEILAQMRYIAATSKKPKLEVLEEMIMLHILTAYDKSSRHCDPLNMESHSKRVRSELSHYFRQEIELFAQVLAQAAQKREIPPQSNDEKTAEILVQAMSCYLPPHNLKFTRVEIEQEARRLLGWLLKGLAVEDNRVLSRR